MQWKKRRLNPQAGHQQYKNQNQRVVNSGISINQMTAITKRQITHQTMQPGNGQQQYGTASERINQVSPPRPQCFFCAPMDHQRISRQRQNFVKEEEREEVPRQRYPHGAGDTQAEKTEESPAIRRVLKIPYRVDGGQQPEYRRKSGKHH